MEEDLVTIFCISCGFVSTVPLMGGLPKETQRMVCTKCRYSFHLASLKMGVQTRPSPPGVFRV